MLREEPKVRYYYEVIEPIFIPKEDAQRIFGFSPRFDWKYEKGNTIESTIKDLDSSKFRKLWSYRASYIGDMQEKLNKAFDCNLMERYAKSGGYVKTKIQYVFNERIQYRDRWIPMKLISDLKEWVKSKVYKYNDPNNYKEEVINGWFYED